MYNFALQPKYRRIEHKYKAIIDLSSNFVVMIASCKFLLHGQTSFRDLAFLCIGSVNTFHCHICIRAEIARGQL